jgi:hypothetical protein
MIGHLPDQKAFVRDAIASGRPHGEDDAVIERYRTGLLSHRQVGEALSLDY